MPPRGKHPVCPRASSLSMGSAFLKSGQRKCAPASASGRLLFRQAESWPASGDHRLRMGADAAPGLIPASDLFPYKGNCFLTVHFSWRSSSFRLFKAERSLDCTVRSGSFNTSAVSRRVRSWPNRSRTISRWFSGRPATSCRSTISDRTASKAGSK